MRVWTTFICLYGLGSSEALALTCLFFGRRPGYGLQPYADTCPYFLLFARRTGRWTTFICFLAGNCWAEAAPVACSWAMDYVYMPIRELVRVCRGLREVLRSSVAPQRDFPSSLERNSGSPAHGRRTLVSDFIRAGARSGVSGSGVGESGGNPI
jgi:hypothetical protein